MARQIFDQVEAATLGGWHQAARKTGVPHAMLTYWEREMMQQTQALREDARRPAKLQGRRPSG